MRILLLTRAGERIVARKSVTGEWLRVGRNASCEIHLPDPRVALEQGLITRPDEGFVYSEGEAGSHSVSRKAVRQGPWKLVENELYNLADDLAESRDLASQRPELVRDLKAKLAAWEKDVMRAVPPPPKANAKTL